MQLNCLQEQHKYNRLAAEEIEYHLKVIYKCDRIRKERKSSYIANETTLNTHTDGHGARWFVGGGWRMKMQTFFHTFGSGKNIE